MKAKSSVKQSSEIQVRSARLTDLNLLVRHRRKMWEDIGRAQRASQLPWRRKLTPKDLDRADIVYRKWAETRIKNRTLYGWLATVEGANAGSGCLWLQPIQPRPRNKKLVQPYLHSMYTEPAYRGRGIASAIVEATIKWAKQNGFESMRLHASDMGRSVYLALGFEASREMRLIFDKAPSSVKSRR